MIARFHNKNRILSIVMLFVLVASMVTACTEAEPEPTATTAPVAATDEPAPEEPTAEPAPAGCPNFGDVTLNVMSVGEAYASAFRMYEDVFQNEYGISFTYDFSAVINWTLRMGKHLLKSAPAPSSRLWICVIDHTI